jgi:hypothetical protein
MATKKPTQPKTPAVPQPGSRPTVRVDDALSDDLAILMRTGANLSDAIRAAVGQAADMYRTAWAHGVVPEGETPILLAFQFAARPTDAPAMTRPYDALSDRPAVPRVGRRMAEPFPVRQPTP